MSTVGGTARVLACAMGLLTTIAVAAPPGTSEARREAIEQRDDRADAESLARKARSESALRAAGVPVNPYLPAIESSAQAKRRSTEEVAYRALALLAVALKGEGLDAATTQRVVRDYGLAPHLSPQERAFVANASAAERERVNFSWRYESAWTLLWALGYVESLAPPKEVCDVGRAVKVMHERTAAQFVAQAKLRPMAEVLDATDAIYRMHWAVVEARVNGSPLPAGLHPGIVYERHYALNWLIGYMDQAWDDVSTDT